MLGVPQYFYYRTICIQWKLTEGLYLKMQARNRIIHNLRYKNSALCRRVVMHIYAFFTNEYQAQLVFVQCKTQTL